MNTRVNRSQEEVTPQQKDERQPWAIEDSIGFEYFVGDQASPWWPTDGKEQKQDIIVHSPDRAHFFFVSHRGHLANDSNIFRLAIYSTDAIVDALATSMPLDRVSPAAIIEMENSSSIEPAIKGARWALDSRSVLFLGANGDGTKAQVFQLGVHSSVAEQLTHARQPIVSFEHSNGGLYYRSSNAEAQDRIYGRKSDLPYPSFTAQRSHEGLAYVRAPYGPSHNLGIAPGFVQFGQGKPHPVNISRAWLSPDGRFALGLNVERNAYGLQLQYVLADTRSGEISMLVGAAPSASAQNDATGTLIALAAPQAIWSSDNESVVLINGPLPRDYTNSHNLSRAHGYVVQFNLKDRCWTVLEAVIQENTTDESYATKNSAKPERLVIVGANGHLIHYSRHGGKWTACVTDYSETSAAPNIEVFVRQSANAIPAVVVRTCSDEHVLATSNEHLSQVSRSSVSEFRWRPFEDAPEQIGALVKPLNTRSNGGFPLVVQLSNPALDYFTPDGHTSSGYAAQLFAAKGYAVLSFQTHYPPLEQKNTEGRCFLTQFESAVEHLAGTGIVDPTKVALIGFSREGYHALYAVTHARRIRLCAAVCLDSFSGSYSTYLREASLNSGPNSPLDHEYAIGGSFWQNKAEWLERETTFNVDRVRTPTMFMQFGVDAAGAPLITDDMIGAFKLNRKPMEYVCIPTGMHNLIRPSERYAALRATVDWVEFWLSGKAPADEVKAAQWDLLLALQHESMSVPLPPRMKWVAVPDEQS